METDDPLDLRDSARSRLRPLALPPNSMGGTIVEVGIEH